MKKAVVIGLVLNLSSAFAQARHAEDGPTKYKAAEQTTIGLHQAIDMAEKQSGGKVTRVVFTHRGGAWIYAMEVQTAGGALSVDIDADSGILKPAS
jgi:uncharacterized membrane protein YkoI